MSFSLQFCYYMLVYISLDWGDFMSRIGKTIDVKKPTKEQLEEYNSLFNKAEEMIKKVESLGFDVSEYSEELKKISFPLKLDYSYDISRLKRLIGMLKEFDGYFKAFDIISSLDVLVNSVNNNVDKINSLVDNMIDALNMINSVSGYHEGEENIKVKVFEGVYKLIKLDVINNFDSKLYDHIKINKLDSYFLHEAISREMEKLTISSEEYSKYEEKIYELRSSGLREFYGDLETIKLILRHKNKFLMQPGVMSKLNALLDNFDDNNRELSTLNNKCLVSKSTILERLEKPLSNIKKSAIKRLTAFGLATTLTISGGVGIYFGTKKLCSDDFYERSITTYSDLKGLDNYSEDISVSDVLKCDNKTFINVYGLWDKKLDSDGRTKREVTVYDVSDIKLDNIKDYLNCSLDNVYYCVKEQYGDPDNLLEYDEPYVEVEQNSVDTSKVKRYVVDDNKNSFITMLVGFYALYIVFCLMVSLVREKSNIEIGISAIEELYFYIKQKKLTVDNLKFMETNVREMLEIINSNEKLKLEFDKLYKENLYLIEQPEKLMMRFEKLSHKCSDIGLNIGQFKEENVKKLIKAKE